MYEMSADEMVEKLPMFQNWSPCLDGGFIKEEVDLGMLSDTKGEAGRPEWCERVLIGDVAQDVSLFSPGLESLLMFRYREVSSKLASWTTPTSWSDSTILSLNLAAQKKVNGCSNHIVFLGTYLQNSSMLDYNSCVRI